MTRLFASEKLEYTDPKTGARVIRWTASGAKDQHLYFTGPSVTDDDRWLVILSERTGHPNLHAIDRRTGEIHALSANARGLLASYVYPLGGARGLSKASASMDGESGQVIWIQDGGFCTRRAARG